MEKTQYKKPPYNPWDLDPTQIVIQDSIKYLKREATKLLEQLQTLKKYSGDDKWVLAASIQEYEQEHRKVCNKIRDYEIRLRGHKETGSWHQEAKAGYITSEDIDIARQHSISDFLSDRVRKSGSRSYTLCPLVPEKTPSFVVYDQQNTFHCFSCGAGSSVIDLVMQLYGLSFIEAIKLILNR